VIGSCGHRTVPTMKWPQVLIVSQSRSPSVKYSKDQLKSEHSVHKRSLTSTSCCSPGPLGGFVPHLSNPFGLCHSLLSYSSSGWALLSHCSAEVEVQQGHMVWELETRRCLLRLLCMSDKQRAGWLFFLGGNSFVNTLADPALYTRQLGIPPLGGRLWVSVFHGPMDPSKFLWL
jgi:hypothetical protein